MSPASQSTIRLSGFLPRWKKLQRRQKVFLYANIVLFFSLWMVPLIRISSSAIDVQTPGTTYAVYKLFYVTTYEYTQVGSGVTTVGSTINTGSLSLGIFMMLLIMLMIERNLSYRVKKYMHALIGYKISEHIANTVILLFLLSIILAMTNGIAMLQGLSRVSIYDYSIIRLVSLLVAMTVWQLYLLIYSVQEKKQKKYSTPFSSSDLLYQQAMQHAREPQHEELVGGLFDDEEEQS